MIVVSDTPPLNYLALTGHATLLQQLFGEVFIPPAVALELSHLKTPAPTKELLQTASVWLYVRNPSQSTVDRVRQATTRKLAAADIEAISLAMDIQASYLLTDAGMPAPRQRRPTGFR